MAMAADSSASNHSPRSPVTPSSVAATTEGGGGINSPQSPRRSLPSPWAQVVRGGEPESSSVAAPVTAPRSPSSSPPIAATPAPEQTPFSNCSGQKVSQENSAPETQTESSDNGNGNAGRPKKPAWNKPLNGVVEASSVMGDSVSWPALSESTRPTPKSSSESSKPYSDGSTSSSQGPLIAQTPQKLVNTNVNSNSTGNHAMHRQRSMKHRGSGPSGGSSQGGYNGPPLSLQPAFSTIEIPPFGNYGNFVPPVLDSPVRGARPMGGSGSQSGNDHSSHPQRNSSRRNNFGPRPRGNGQYHNNHGGRRDSDRRDVHLPHQFIPPGSYIPPPPHGTGPFIGSPHARPPFVGPVSFDMTSQFMFVPTLPPEPFRGGMPLITQPPAAHMYFPVMDPPLQALIIKQIDYYFSDANLVKDDYLRSNMDDEGWVPINLIASFPRVQQLTMDVQLILDSLRASVVVEVKEQGDKIRRRNDWRKWLHSGTRFSPDLGSQTPGTSSDDMLTTSIEKSVEKMSLNEETSNNRGTMNIVDSQMEIAPDRSLPEEPTCPSNMANGELTAEEAHPSQT